MNLNVHASVNNSSISKKRLPVFCGKFLTCMFANTYLSNSYILKRPSGTGSPGIVIGRHDFPNTGGSTSESFCKCLQCFFIFMPVYQLHFIGQKIC